MNDSVTQHISTMPPQHIHSSRKTDEWGRRCVLAIQGMSNTHINGRTSREEKEINYNIVNSQFDSGEFEHVLNPYGFDTSKYGGTATKLQNYNIIRSGLETLRGEEMNTPLDFFVKAISGEAVSAKKTKKLEMLKEMMKASIRIEFGLDEQIQELEGQMQGIQKEMATVQDQNVVQQMQQQLQQLQEQRNNMPDIQAEMKKFNSEYIDPTESTNNKILEYLKRNDNLELKFNQGWFHALVSAEEVYYTGIQRGHPTVRVVNPLNFEFDKGSDTAFIQDGNWAKEEFWLPIGEVIEMYGDVLTKTQVKEISEGRAGYSIVRNGMEQGFAYSFEGGQRRSYSAAGGDGSHVYIMNASWRSFAKVGILKYKDPRTGKWEEVEVDDTFKLTPQLKEMEAQLEWFYDTEIWEGTMIGNNMFINVHPKFNQTKNLPYIGYIYNNINSVATSMVDLVKGYQYTYIIIWWRLEQELAKAQGKKFVMDIAQLPQSKGWDVDQWMYYFTNLGVIWINSKEEGRKGDPQSIATFNQFQAIDMSLSQVVGQYMSIIEKLELLVEEAMGVPPQRRGGIKPSETATGAQTAISRSTNVTRPWFYFHDLVKQAVLTEILELAKIAYIDGKELELIISEFEVETLKIDGNKLNGSDMGVFVTNSYKDRANKEKMSELVSMAVNQGKASLIDIANIIDSDSMSYIKTSLAEGERKAQEAAQANSKAQQEMAAQALEQARKERELDRAKDVEIVEKEIQKDILLKKMDIAAKKSDGDLTEAGLIADTALKGEKLEIEKHKEANRVEESKQSMDIKEKEIAAKTKLNKSKNT